MSEKVEMSGFGKSVSHSKQLGRPSVPQRAVRGRCIIVPAPCGKPDSTSRPALLLRSYRLTKNALIDLGCQCAGNPLVPQIGSSRNRSALRRTLRPSV